MTCVSRYGCAVRLKVVLVMPGPPVLIPEYDARNCGTPAYKALLRGLERGRGELGVARSAPREDALGDGDPVDPGPQLRGRKAVHRRADRPGLRRRRLRGDPGEGQ